MTFDADIDPALRVLAAVATCDRPALIGEVASISGVCHRTVQRMVKRGFVTRGDRYCVPGEWRLTEAGRAALDSLGVVRLVCQGCGGPFECDFVTAPWRKYCSNKCNRTAWDVRHAAE